MASRDEWPDNPNELPPVPQRAGRDGGMNGCLKAALIIGGIGSVLCLACCAGVAWFGRNFVPKTVSAPVEVASVAQKILKVDIPDDFVGESASTIDNVMMRMLFASFRHKQGKGRLLMGIVQSKMGTVDGQNDIFKKQSNEFGAANTKGTTAEKITVRDFTIRGQTVPFQFVQAMIKSETGGDPKKVRMVNGSITSPNSLLIFNLTLDDDVYDEDAVVNMIKSIQ